LQRADALQVGGDRRNGGRGKAGRGGDVGMGERSLAAERREHERAVLLTHHFGARFHQHGRRPIIMVLCDMTFSKIISTRRFASPSGCVLTAPDSSDIYFLDCREKL